ncbi:heme ABC transporter permease CcmC [Aquabacterium sp. A3]|uniref:heme ABC transporter permease CcmC n=1 Tax=Aquabacterium sp. A3 TaxID=3132829 RepID=UPI003119EB33
MRHWTRYAAPARFAPLVRPWLPWLWAACLVSALAGLAVGLVLAPTDAQQGQSYRILYIHVPAAWMSMLLYLVMAFWAAVGWVWRVRLAFMLARAVAPTGALFTGIALLSGALWGQPTWGTWWVWDARLTSELILLFLYLGCLSLFDGFDDPERGDHAGALLAMVGAVNVPIIYFSVVWWNTLHQGATITATSAPRMDPAMLCGLLLCTLASWLYAIAVVLTRTLALIGERERDRHWMPALSEPDHA